MLNIPHWSRYLDCWPYTVRAPLLGNRMLQLPLQLHNLHLTTAMRGGEWTWCGSQQHLSGLVFWWWLSNWLRLLHTSYGTASFRLFIFIAWKRWVLWRKRWLGLAWMKTWIWIFTLIHLALIGRLSILHSFNKGRNTHDVARLSEVRV